MLHLFSFSLNIFSFCFFLSDTFLYSLSVFVHRKSGSSLFGLVSTGFQLAGWFATAFVFSSLFLFSLSPLLSLYVFPFLSNATIVMTGILTRKQKFFALFFPQTFSVLDEEGEKGEEKKKGKEEEPSILNISLSHL